MENLSYLPNSIGFNEAEWIKLIFLLSDIESRVHEMQKDVFGQLPVSGKNKLFKKNYYLSTGSLAHILERHYYKINRHPGTGKFTVPVTAILHYIKEAFQLPVTMHGCGACLVRSFDTGVEIGIDKNGVPTTVMSILTDSSGIIKTAYPGSP